MIPLNDRYWLPWDTQNTIALAGIVLLAFVVFIVCAAGRKGDR